MDECGGRGRERGGKGGTMNHEVRRRENRGRKRRRRRRRRREGRKMLPKKEILREGGSAR
jgi:hypothetical protein